MSLLSSATDIRLGESPVSAVYLGSVLCWQRVEPIPTSLLTLKWIMNGLVYSSKPATATAENCTCQVYYCSTSISGDYSVPESINGIPLTELTSSCFANCDGLTSIVLGDNITSIGTNAFSGCAGLRSVQINTSAFLPTNTFSYCSSLQKVSFGSNAVYSSSNTNSYQFYGCALTSFNAGALGNVMAKTGLYGTCVLGGNTSITEAVFPQDFEPPSLQSCSFYLKDCTSLTTVKVYNPTMLFPNYMLDGLSALTTVYGYAGSTAQTWAAANSMTFIALPH